MSDETREQLLSEVFAKLKTKTVDELKELLVLAYQMQEEGHEKSCGSRNAVIVNDVPKFWDIK